MRVCIYNPSPPLLVARRSLCPQVRHPVSGRSPGASHVQRRSSFSALGINIASPSHAPCWMGWHNTVLQPQSTIKMTTPSSQSLSASVTSLRSSLSLLDSSISILDSGISDFPRLKTVLSSTRVCDSLPPLDKYLDFGI